MSNFRYDHNLFRLNKSKELICRHTVIYSNRPLKEWAIRTVVRATTEKGFSVSELKRALKRDVGFHGISYGNDAGSLTVVHVY
jgi:hypothetical protein